jgi:hypothetical protein
MTPARTQSVSAERIVATAPHQIFDVLTDPNQHPVLDGSGMVQSSRRRNPKRLQLGSKFRMDMKLGPLPSRSSRPTGSSPGSTRAATGGAGSWSRPPPGAPG